MSRAWRGARSAKPRSSHCCTTWGTRAIADELLIAQATAKSHMRKICQKLGVHSQVELTELANREERECWER